MLTRGLTVRKKILPMFVHQCLLKYCISFSCFLAASSEEKVPRFLLLFVFGFFLREYNRYCPDANFLIIIFLLIVIQFKTCITRQPKKESCCSNLFHKR